MECFIWLNIIFTLKIINMVEGQYEGLDFDHASNMDTDSEDVCSNLNIFKFKSFKIQS